MARNVFISFRYSDGHRYKDELSRRFDRYDDTVDFSEDVNRAMMSDATIQSYLFQKLRRSSVTIILLTPEAVNHRKGYFGYSDWMYDEIRYSLEDRGWNRTNGIIAVYTEEAEPLIFENYSGEGNIIKNFDNLCRANMLNVKAQYKTNKEDGWYDRLEDSYCSLVSYDEFVRDISRYIDNAVKKRNEKYKYNIRCRL